MVFIFMYNCILTDRMLIFKTHIMNHFLIFCIQLHFKHKSLYIAYPCRVSVMYRDTSCAYLYFLNCCTHIRRSLLVSAGRYLSSVFRSTRSVRPRWPCLRSVLRTPRVITKYSVRRKSKTSWNIRSRWVKITTCKNSQGPSLC